MTSNSAWVTTMRSQPASRAASMIARASSPDECPVSTTSFCAPHSFRTSRTAGSTLPSSPTTLIPEGASLSRVIPPAAPLSVMPPKIFMPGTRRRAIHARSAARAVWLLRTTASIPRSFESAASSSSVRARPNTSGAVWTWKSISPSTGLVSSHPSTNLQPWGTRGYRAMERKHIRKTGALRYVVLLPILLLVAATTAGAQTPGKAKVDRLVMGLITPYLDYVRPWINGTADHNIQHDPMHEWLIEVDPSGHYKPWLADSWTQGPNGRSWRVK